MNIEKVRLVAPQQESVSVVLDAEAEFFKEMRHAYFLVSANVIRDIRKRKRKLWASPPSSFYCTRIQKPELFDC